MTSANPDSWEFFNSALDSLKRGITQSKAVKVNVASLREQAKSVAQLYFRQVRPELQTLKIDFGLINQLDEHIQLLLRLSNGANAKNSYLSLFKELYKVIAEVVIAKELRHAEEAFLSISPQQNNSISGLESIIYDTLFALVPTAALSYKQALLDLTDKNRISYRGVANEFRESLRETLDHLAPDKNVEAQPNFKFEKDKTTPTMKQKVRYILKARELASNAIKTPENAVDIIEERVASFARSAYERSSISAHVASSRNEVLQMKNYVNAILAELLGLQT